MRSVLEIVILVVGVIVGVTLAAWAGHFVWSFDWGPWGRRSWNLGLLCLIFSVFGGFFAPVALAAWLTDVITGEGRASAHTQDPGS